MPDVTSPRARILSALEHGPLDELDIAEVTGMAPFAVRADLKGMARHRLVRGHGPLEWELTDDGYTVLWESHQIPLF